MERGNKKRLQTANHTEGHAVHLVLCTQTHSQPQVHSIIITVNYPGPFRPQPLPH